MSVWLVEVEETGGYRHVNGIFDCELKAVKNMIEYVDEDEVKLERSGGAYIFTASNYKVLALEFEVNQVY